MNDLYRSYLTLLEMLKDRLYTIPPITLSEVEFLQTIASPGYKLVYSKVLVDRKGDYKPGTVYKTQLFFVKHTANNDTQNLGKKNIEMYKTMIEQDHIQSAILVLMNIDVTSCAKKEIEACKPKFFIETFNTNKVLINITKHQKVPTHILLTDAEKNDLIQKRGLKMNEIPKISETDPVSLYFGAEVGQVFKILSYSESCGVYESYRVVI